jgi:hypothetical protein
VLYGTFAKIHLKKNNIGITNSLNEYAASYYDIQINRKTPKHLILAFNLTEIGTT